MAAKRKTKKVTLREFQSWLAGVEELQPDGWAPTADQWKLIRAKIDNIVEEKITPAALEAAITSAVGTQHQPAHRPSLAPATVAAPGMPPGFTPAPLAPSGIPNAEVTMTPEARAHLEGTKTLDSESGSQSSFV